MDSWCQRNCDTIIVTSKIVANYALFQTSQRIWLRSEEAETEMSSARAHHGHLCPKLS